LKVKQRGNNPLDFVDIFECLGCLITFSGQEYLEKTTFIFKLFDFDDSGFIEKRELILTLQAVIRGLCKLVNLPIPHLKEIEILALNCFHSIDIDYSQSIDLKEFNN